jgi:quinol monooxygenase YgiN
VDEVVVVATFRAQPGRGPDVEAGLQEAIRLTHGEPGCIRYALQRGISDPDLVVLVERWASAGHLARHAERPHVTGLRARLDMLAEPPRVDVLQPVPAGDAEKGLL